MNHRHGNLVLVAGATGKQGGAVARSLLNAGHKVRIMTRKPEGAAAKELQKLGAEVVRGDYAEPDSLVAPLTGAWGAFSIQNPWEGGIEGEERDGKEFAKVARDTGVQHFVYTSVASAHRKTGIPHFENKARIEETVRSLQFASHVILRPAFFMENFNSHYKPAIDKGVLDLSVQSDTVLQMIAVKDIGEYGRVAFEQHDALNRREIDIAGDELTIPETAAIISKAAGHPVKHVPAPLAEVRKFSADVAQMMEWFGRVGFDVDIEANANEFGIRPTRLAEWANSVSWK